ncbi:hypothetical protein M0G43_10160 [Subsaxibacter sp. CAU 1640]|uniref:hypothetical protein n=1 Tax=Subsaxibacter sp. CAU 1640 TaxID=2933271 RepID=UPI0020050594|nr:hypothetical protein [Subsaxibacter sp. CAU 1640]MCK7590935.1 hypothetical protein [Subsaxibacter sp. CAU 1640]
MNLKLNILTLLICGFYGFTQNNDELDSNYGCLESKVYLKTEIQEKPKRILFFKTRLKKVKTIDRILDADSNIVLERITKSIGHGDAWEIKSFNRLKIENNKIVEYQLTNKPDYGKAIFYNKCGLKIAEKKLDANLVMEKFMFE